MKPEEFIAMLLPAARECHKLTGIPASFTIAQAALESGWGEKAPGNNLFGIKPGPRWKGPIVTFSTHEYVKGVRMAVEDTFRAYPDYAACLADRAGFFRDNPRYKECFKERTGHGWALAVARAGYATDPSYAATLIRVMDGRKMSQYDLP